TQGTQPGEVTAHGRRCHPGEFADALGIDPAKSTRQPALSDSLIDRQPPDRGLGKFPRSKTRGRHGPTLVEGAQRPNWRLRSAAAATASRNAARTARPSSTRSPAAVVPPGDVTWARSSSGDSPVTTSSAAEPSKVPTTSWRDTSRERPWCTPASISDSTTRYRYAGMDPDSPVTASTLRSVTRTTVPTAPRIPSAQSRSSLVTCDPPAMALTPLPTSTGVLGMDRMTATGPGNAASIRAVERPATTDRSLVTPAVAATRAAAFGWAGLRHS